MVTQELVLFIKTQLANGVSADSIKQSLLSNNWQQNDIDQAFFSLQQPDTQPNTSGMGDKSTVPSEIKGFSWAAFLWNWIWAIGNNTWIGLLVFVPFVGQIMIFILGIYGNEWAWKNKHWDSIEAFKKTQKKWVRWWLYIALPLMIIAFLGAIFVFVLAAINPLGRLKNK